MSGNLYFHSVNICRALTEVSGTVLGVKDIAVKKKKFKDTFGVIHSVMSTVLNRELGRSL